MTTGEMVRTAKAVALGAVLGTVIAVMTPAEGRRVERRSAGPGRG